MIDSDVSIVMDGATCFFFELDGIVALYDDLHFILNFHKHIHVRFKAAFHVIPTPDEVFTFPVRNYFRFTNSPPMLDIIAAFLNNIFEEIVELAPHEIERSQGGIRASWEHLMEISTILIRLKLYWLKLYNTQNSRALMEMKSDIFLAIAEYHFPHYIRFAHQFKESTINAFKMFQENPEIEVIPIHNLTLFPHEGLSEGFKLVLNVPQVLTQETVTENLQMVGRGLFLNNDGSSLLNGITIFTPSNN